MWCGLGSEAVCLILCTKCASCFPYKNGARDRGRGPDSPRISFLARERSHDRRDNRCYGTVPVLSTRSSCEMAVKTLGRLLGNTVISFRINT